MPEFARYLVCLWLTSNDNQYNGICSQTMPHITIATAQMQSLDASTATDAKEWAAAVEEKLHQLSIRLEPNLTLNPDRYLQQVIAKVHEEDHPALTGFLKQIDEIPVAESLHKMPQKQAKTIHLSFLYADAAAGVEDIRKAYDATGKVFLATNIQVCVIDTTLGFNAYEKWLLL